MPEIRCANKLFGYVAFDATGIFEALCNSLYCGASKHTVVRHRWDLGKPTADGNGVKLIETRLFKRPK